MIIKNVNLETVCGITSAIPDNLLDEVAFAGKSNVGKSSLINALMNRKSLARTSSQPGKTQTINFYNVNEAMPSAENWAFKSDAAERGYRASAFALVFQYAASGGCDFRDGVQSPVKEYIRESSK